VEFDFGQAEPGLGQVEFGFGKAESVSTPVVQGQKPVVQNTGLNPSWNRIHPNASKTCRANKKLSTRFGNGRTQPISK